MNKNNFLSEIGNPFVKILLNKQLEPIYWVMVALNIIAIIYGLKQDKFDWFLTLNNYQHLGGIVLFLFIIFVNRRQ